ncbi:MAG: TIGR03617 family F420-dependent LLM class oxidoreductase [Acidimicrobiia bacterium]
MHFDLMTGNNPLARMAQLAVEWEQLGFSGITLTETGRTAYLSAAVAAVAAPSLSLTTGIAVAFPRSPMITASTAWELAEATDGKFLLGLGTQVKAHIERRFSSEFEPPGPRLREYIQAVRACFNAFDGREKLDFKGQYYNLTLLPDTWKPGKIAHPDIPIYISAVGPWMTRMAGEVADGIHVHPLHSVRYLNEVLLPKVAEGAATADRSVDDVKLAIPVFTIVGDTEEERAPWRDRARSQIAFYGSTKNYAFQFEMLGFDGVSARLNDRLKAGDLQGMSDLISDEMLEHYAVTATWDELADKLVDRYRGVADRLIMYFAQPQMERFPETSGRWGEVARTVRAAG